MSAKEGSPVIQTLDLGKRYQLGADHAGGYTTLRDAVGTMLRGGSAPVEREEFWALRNVSIEVPEGQVLGIIGANGAGKSTLLKVLSRITEPTEGEVRLRGRVASLLEVGTGFHPELTGRENVFLNGVILGMKRREVAAKLDAIVAFAGVERFLDTPVKRYSSGMYLRLAFSVAVHLDPDILIVDEVLAVGDAEFQQRCLGKMEAKARGGRTVLFVSHNMAAVRSLCDRVVWMQKGRVFLQGDPGEVVDAYLQSGLAEENFVEWKGMDAPGAEGVRLRRFAVSGGDGGSLDMRSDLPITVEMMLEIESLPDALVVGFDLLSSEGATIFRTCHTDKATSEWLDLRPGLNRLMCELPPGLLNRGRFFLAPKAWIKGTRGIFSLPPTLSFSVRLMHGDSPYWIRLGPTEKPGLTAPILDWRMSPE